MKLPFPFSASLLLGASLLLLAPATQADTFRGKIRLRGSVQNAAKPGSLTFIMTGRMTSPDSEEVASVTGGGLFRTTTGAIANTTFTGPLKINVNVAGDITRSRKNVSIKVSRRTIRFPGGRVRLDRPIDPRLFEKQRIKGTGTFRFTVK